MPLHPDSSRAVADYEGFAFSMHSGSDVVAVLVTPEAVQQLSSSQEASLDQLAQHRSSFETIASAKYDRGEMVGSRITVWSTDLPKSDDTSASESSPLPS
jgi:acetylornithine/succinyldiaminopimelate/putrescine aminotransferase